VSIGSAAPIVRRTRIWRRTRRVLPLTLLLLICLFLLFSITAHAMRVMLEVRTNQQVQAGVATGVRPWMTVNYISRVYGIPENEVLAALALSDTDQHRRAPLRAIASHEGRHLDADIARLNALIDTRRATPTVPPQATP
jgi:hypothetical protein